MNIEVFSYNFYVFIKISFLLTAMKIKNYIDGSNQFKKDYKNEVSTDNLIAVRIIELMIMITIIDIVRR